MLALISKYTQNPKISPHLHCCAGTSHHSFSAWISATTLNRSPCSCFCPCPSLFFEMLQQLCWNGSQLLFLCTMTPYFTQTKRPKFLQWLKALHDLSSATPSLCHLFSCSAHHWLSASHTGLLAGIDQAPPHFASWLQLFPLPGMLFRQVTLLDSLASSSSLQFQLDNEAHPYLPI